jgi:hypothetical protein
MPTRRQRLVGFTYQTRGALKAEVRKSCRDELKILYSGRAFDAAVWDRVASLGAVNVFEASKLNNRMKDLVRVHGSDGLRIEGARDGELVVVFFAPAARRLRKRVEALLAG